MPPRRRATLAPLVQAAPRGVVVAGRMERPATPAGEVPAIARAAAAFSAATGWPVLADPLSGARCGEGAVAHYDALLRDPRVRQRGGAARASLRVGDLPTSKPLREWLAGLDASRSSSTRTAPGRTPRTSAT